MGQGIYYCLTQKGKLRDFTKDFFTFFPEEIVIIDLLRIEPSNIRKIKIELEGIESDRFDRKLNWNNFKNLKNPKEYSYDKIQNIFKKLKKDGLIKFKK